MVGSQDSPTPALDGSALTVAVIRARFNDDITSKLREGALEALRRHGVPAGQIIDLDVPGAVELPLAAKMVIEARSVDAVVCLGAVIRGETAHFDYVCQMASEGILRVGLDTGVPVSMGVLTCENREQALARVQPGDQRGSHAADAAVEMALFRKALAQK